MSRSSAVHGLIIGLIQHGRQGEALEIDMTDARFRFWPRIRFLARIGRQRREDQVTAPRQLRRLLHHSLGTPQITASARDVREQPSHLKPQATLSCLYVRPVRPDSTLLCVTQASTGVLVRRGGETKDPEICMIRPSLEFRLRCCWRTWLLLAVSRHSNEAVRPSTRHWGSSPSKCYLIHDS